jgi:hypothetical protein
VGKVIQDLGISERWGGGGKPRRTMTSTITTILLRGRLSGNSSKNDDLLPIAGRHVGKVIQDLGLSKSQDTIIGNDRRRGVSGGERRVRNRFGVLYAQSGQSGIGSTFGIGRVGVG